MMPVLETRGLAFFIPESSDNFLTHILDIANMMEIHIRKI